MDELGCVGNERLCVFEDGEDGKDGVAAHVRVAVLKALANAWHDRLEQLGLLELAQKAQCSATHKLIGVQQVFAVGVAHKNHFVQQLALRIRLWYQFPVDQEQFLDHVILHQEKEIVEKKETK